MKATRCTFSNNVGAAGGAGWYSSYVGSGSEICSRRGNAALRALWFSMMVRNFGTSHDGLLPWGQVGARMVSVDEEAGWCQSTASGKKLRRGMYRSASVSFRPTYSVTPGSLTLWSVHLLRRIKRNRAPLTATNAAIMANTLASNRRFPMNPTLGRWIHSVHWTRSLCLSLSVC
jgi:hypothetical protein